MAKYYYLSLGSNVSAKRNCRKAIRKLVELFGPVHFYPFVETKPCKVAGGEKFLNSLLVISSSRDPADIKTIFNKIEKDFGRDRDNPDSSVLPRELDIDILFTSDFLDFEKFKSVDEPYLVEVMKSVKSHPELPCEVFDLPGPFLFANLSKGSLSVCQEKLVSVV